MGKAIRISLPAKAILELLESSDPEIKVEIQNHILKTVLDKQFSCSMPADFNKQCKVYMDKLADKYFKIPSGSYNGGQIIKQSIREELRAVADAAFSSAHWKESYKPTKEQIDRVLCKAAKNLEQYVQDRVIVWEKSIEAHIDKKVNSTLTKSIDHLVDAKVELLMAQKALKDT